jgi:hypothetical protein
MIIFLKNKMKLYIVNKCGVFRFQTVVKAVS